MTKEKHQCAETGIYEPNGAFGGHKCRVNATIFEEGKWWCRYHAPSIVNAKREARNRRFEEQYDKEKQAFRRQQAALWLVRDIPTEMLDNPELRSSLLQISQYIAEHKNFTIVV